MPKKIQKGLFVRVSNTSRDFGENLDYYALQAVYQGKQTPMLFTQSQIEAAVKRARENPEDMPRVSFWGRIFRR